MATTYKTPGAYVEEIVKFPPSVAQVETAIPAFIGYTEKATKKIESDLLNIPTRISSLLEYETYFGFAYPETTISVDITDILLNGTLQRDIVVNQPSIPKPFLMYYSLQMYFANGGGPCYIISVDTYEDENGNENTVSFDLLDDGLDLLKAEDEPTLILFPDAKALSEINFYSLYNNALIQCHDMQDRFTIIDTLTSTDSFDDSEVLRNRINLEKDYLKYGAAYYPHLETILDYDYNEDAILINHISYDADAMPTSLVELNASKTNIPPIILDLVTVTAESVAGTLPAVIEYIESPTGYDNAGAETFTVAQTTAFVLLLDALIVDLDSLVSEKKLIKNAAKSAIASVEESASADDDIVTALAAITVLFEGNNKIENVLKNLKDLATKLKSADTDTKVGNLIKTNTTNVINEVAKLLVYTPILGLPDVSLAITTNVFSTISTLLDTLIAEVDSVKAVDINNGAMNGRFLGDIESLNNASYNIIKAEISNLPLTIPPSSSIAGVYARTDSNRGVWKAPANVGLNYVVKPTIKITNNEQDNLNVDTTAGKSINAIRNFTGKGILVWGARTLAGNDNEWRYVPVRRFFNMAEESIKKATEQFVFEPNDANTWIRVRAMIENFLILQWRAGALAGAKPEQAFYVRVGLGQTMSALDILEGRMIVEIGMAVVRPAEFIILKFSHKMQEA
ncbi:phage tail sheath family protein [Flavobacterium adhaerens]|uniref:phage tail sheath family protein n=1 Tax=Flavobacterium adhaerens TaxID=3149043 RepID=UPI0032B51B29